MQERPLHPAPEVVLDLAPKNPQNQGSPVRRHRRDSSLRSEWQQQGV